MGEVVELVWPLVVAGDDEPDAPRRGLLQLARGVEPVEAGSGVPGQLLLARRRDQLVVERDGAGTGDRPGDPQFAGLGEPGQAGARHPFIGHDAALRSAEVSSGSPDRSRSAVCASAGVG